jgi:hypothetical protein
VQKWSDLVFGLAAGRGDLGMAQPAKIGRGDRLSAAWLNPRQAFGVAQVGFMRHERGLGARSVGRHRATGAAPVDGAVTRHADQEIQPPLPFGTEPAGMQPDPGEQILHGQLGLGLAAQNAQGNPVKLGRNGSVKPSERLAILLGDFQQKARTWAGLVSHQRLLLRPPSRSLPMLNETSGKGTIAFRWGKGSVACGSAFALTKCS